MSEHHAQLVLVDDVTLYDVSGYKTADVQSVVQSWQQLGVSEARELTSLAHRTPSDASHQLLIVKTSFITHEAQNALLKLFEEPPATTRFLLVVPKDFQALPTLRSRLSLLEQNNDRAAENDDWNVFVAHTLKDRLQCIETETKAKNTDWMRNIKAGLIATLHTNQSAQKVDAAALGRLHFVASHLLTRGASNKMLLEELALTWPLK